MNNRIENIIIVGGGLSGWLSALFLDRFLNSVDKICNITVLESEEPGSSIEEATTPDFIKFLQILGIDENDFIVNCDVTFKLGIKFVNWNVGGKKDFFWHPLITRGISVGNF